ncbi:hypothetical protein ACFORL_07075 [Legionella dresdenensis]|uniref:VCBS repeat-containing protein n=1 Tax=Legionella dresdenensis TaxID=450200 RepID=A0ABV8CF69_9GAMM
MRIESGNVQLSSNNSSYTRYVKNESLQAGSMSYNPATGESSVNMIKMQNTTVIESYSALSYNQIHEKAADSGMQKHAEQIADANQKQLQLMRAQQAAQNSNPEVELTMEDSLESWLLKLLLEALTGEKFTDSLLEKFVNEQKGKADPEAAAPEAAQAAQAAPAALEVHYQSNEFFYQRQSSSFQAQAQVKTADGQTIQVNLQLNMSSEFMQYEGFEMRLSAALKDPLVLNFGGNAAQLDKRTFEFDLTMDGVLDKVPMLMGNSAFLALDKNEDGKINDGNELFGANTGDGFAELAGYDEDNNGWIDENDSIYEQLMLWFNAGEQGEQQLKSLKEANVGAIYLGKAATPFSVNNPDQEQAGVIRSTGLFLTEQGEAGTVQHVDLAV